MEEFTISIKRYILKYGVILGILSIIYNIIIYTTDNMINRHWLFTLLSAAILISIIIYGIYSFKLANNGFLKLNEALKLGIGIAIIGGAVPFIWNFLLINVVDPEMINQMVNAQKEEMIALNPDISQEEIDRGIMITKKFSSSYMITAFSLISNLLFGFITSLLGGAILQKKRNVF
ncbi:DUF4199 domain-containing protein [Aquimarina macrocephali]|uniref:DUF4199 domain-containing protein n=1 Tax=Aquimarina macrocephali TaxID=666563 RepID=UPI0004651E0E|nr:DUF4199 domain-containing protein [Aquimarina macrocephali]